MSDTGLMSNKEFSERVTDKVRDVFMDLIPDDKLTELVSREVSAFFDGEVDFIVTEKQGYGSANGKVISRISPFRLIVWETVNKLVRDKITEHIESDQFKVDIYYNEFGQTQVHELNDFMDKKLEAFTMEMSRNMFRDLFASAVNASQQAARSEIQQSIANRGY